MRAQVGRPAWGVSLVVLGILLGGCAGVEPETTEGSLDADVEAEWSALHGQYPNVERPEVEIIRRISPDDWATTMAACLNDAGFPDVIAGGDQSLSFETSSAQAAPFALAKYICTAQYPLNEKFTTPLNDEQLGGLYDYLTLVQTPCLESHGFSISAPPSKQHFIETYTTTPDWIPYEQLPMSAFEDGTFAEVEVACPQDPPKDSEYYLY